jgi:Lrp/AsnC family transcriptional regulator for asnA, asnC and gidA
VRKRVAQLVEAEVMQIVAVTDPLQLGFARQAMIGVIVEGPLKPVAEKLAAIEEVDYVVITAGASTSSRRSSAGATPTCSSW